MPSDERNSTIAVFGLDMQEVVDVALKSLGSAKKAAYLIKRILNGIRFSSVVTTNLFQSEV